MSTPTAEMTGTSLLISGDPQAGDTTLCYSCHGIGQLGSNVDIQTPFQGSSVHTLAPGATPYGPKTMYCSTCHDAHGSQRTAGGSPYPSLLRSYEGTHTVYSGEAYCATCHTDASVASEKEHWSGLRVYLTTPHYSAIATPTSGTDIRCSQCHAAHGSNVAPLLVPSIATTSVATTFTVTANDRTFCIACHGTSVGTWDADEYAGSSHGLSTVETTISARWVPVGKRKVGECQVCHAPMGRDDGTGKAIAKLLDASGRKLCDSCHAQDAAASTDTSSQARPMAGTLTLATVFAPDPNSAYAGRVALYGRVAKGPGRLSGPRQYATDDGTGPSVAANVDADPEDELIVASTTGGAINVFDKDPLTGLDLSPDRYTIPGGQPAAAIAVGDFLGDVSDTTPEIALVTSAGRLNFYHISAGVLSLVDGSVDLGSGGPWDLASGDVSGGSQPELVATNKATGMLTIVARNGIWTPTAITVWSGSAPVAPSVGNVVNTASGDEIVVCDAAGLGATETVRVFGGDGSLLGEHMVSAGTGLPTASAFGDVLWGGDSADLKDLAIAFADSTSGESSVVVIPAEAAGLTWASAIEAPSGGTGSFSGSALSGDTDNDGHDELVVGNGGRWSRTGSAFSPRVLVFAADGAGTGLAAPETYLGGGRELAGRAPSLALADFGKPLPSRHPIDEIATASHVSTESASFDRHVTCSDCHNSHEATDAVAAAPLISGPMRGAWGVAVTYPEKTFVAPARSNTGYGVCFKCHSSYNGGTAGGRIDAAADFAPGNHGHAVVGAGTSDAPAATFVDAGMSGTTILRCTDCHGDDGRTGPQADGLHESDSAPLLRSPYLGADPASASVLCYDCHKYGVYATGAQDAAGMSYFRSAGKNLHAIHIAQPASAGTEGHGLSCSSCHVSHGTAGNAAALRPGIGFVAGGTAHTGSCTNDCHNSGTGTGQKTQSW